MADIKRLHYFNHQFLVESDFTDEQQYHLAMRRRHNAALHDYGVADGLAVSRSGDREITIQPGMAIDRGGRELVLLDSRIVSLSDSAAFPAGATVHVTIAYHEEGSDPSTATGVTGDTRTMERPQVLASTTAPAGDGSVIRLAHFTLTAGGNLPGNLGDVFPDGRQIAGAALAPAAVTTDKLADGAVEESKLSAGARGKLVTHGDAHDHSGGDGAQIRHSSLSLDGGSNPHGTTAADVGALASTGGTIVGNLQLHAGNVGLGTMPQPLSRLSLRSDDGPAGIAFATLATTSSDGSGNVTAVDVSAAGSGSGGKHGITSRVSGTGEKHAGYFSATSGAGSDFTQALHADASSEGSGVVMGLWTGLSGSGSGLKIGVVSEVSGAGDKFAGQFNASSPAGSPASTNALSAGAGSDGTGNVRALSVNSGGSGAGQKEGMVCTVDGSGHKYGGQFYSYNRNAGTADVTEGLRAIASSAGTGDTTAFRTSAGGPGTGPKNGLVAHAEGAGRKTAGVFRAIGGGSADGTYGVWAEVLNDGSGEPIAIVASSGGAGTGQKCAVSAHAYGAGHKLAGAFRADGSTDSTDSTLALEALAQSKGSGSVSGIRAFATGEGSGWKEALSCSATGAGPKRAAYFAAESPADSTDRTEGIVVNTDSNGKGDVVGLRIDATGTGTGGKYGLYSHVDGIGPKWAGYFVGNVQVNGNLHVNGVLSKGSGTFLIDHPLDPENKTLRHSFVESPEDLCLYRGKVQLDAAGKGTVKMPSYFAALTREEDATVSLTAIGSKPFLTAYEWNRNFTAFTVYGEPGREVSYLVLADRDDPLIHQLRRPVEEKKGAGHFEKGQLLNPEAYGKAPKAAPDGVSARQTTAQMDMAPPSFPDSPAPPTPTAPPVFSSSPAPTAPFPALDEEQQRMEEAWARTREEQRQRMASFQQEEEQRRRQLEEALAAAHRQADQTPQEHGGPIETDDEAPETPSAAPKSAYPRRKKGVADRKKS
ncbi:hypothetical protein [Candidatus Accumulibacter cognatus]|uniref:Uncharacterized protein n=1 Tax=Candidatus Accumulibacter cognatus TaxID=2954383 RepID=A0A080M1A2_9PROT|nr:hypothetical protein [Candidatus Accumulibacter cognatus]KFB75047.1 MAG: hypothetical protein AW06_003902 [Candidatus Accumulibacter cognatus]